MPAGKMALLWALLLLLLGFQAQELMHGVLKKIKSTLISQSVTLT